MSDAPPTAWVAVTGATGFVGRHVVRALRARGFGVVSLGRRPVPEDDLLRWCPFDLERPSADAIARVADAGCLIHLAWGGLPHYLAERHRVEELPRHRAFLDATLAAGLRRLLVTGTCLEYGMREGELDEGMECRPSNPYAQAKDELRRHLAEACPRFGCAWTWARLFYLYGEGQAPTSIWSQLNEHVRRGEPRFPMSGGQQIRDFLSIERAADCLVALAVPESGSGVVNVCSGMPQTVEATVRGWIAERGWSILPELGRFPYPSYEPFAFWGRRTRLERAMEADS